VTIASVIGPPRILPTTAVCVIYTVIYARTETKYKQSVLKSYRMIRARGEVLCSVRFCRQPDHTVSGTRVYDTIYYKIQYNISYIHFGLGWGFVWKHTQLFIWIRVIGARACIYSYDARIRVLAAPLFSSTHTHTHTHFSAKVTREWR